MATRRVLVFDNDRAFLDLLQNSLDQYGFEVQVAAPGSDDIHMLKVLNPEAIFIAVEAPGKAGYTVCSKVRKAVGKKIPIVLTTATLSQDDLALHGILKVRANVYLDKRSLSRDELLQKLEKLIGLGPRNGPLPPEDNKDLGLSSDVRQIPIREDGSGLLEGSPAEAHEDTNPANQEESTGGKPAGILEFLEETMESEGDANRAVSGQIDVMGDQTVKKDVKGSNDLDRRLAARENEIDHLRRQLEEARRDARSSPFSSEFLGLRERMAQKDSKIIRLTEKLQDSNREILTYKEELREFAKRMDVLKRETDQATEREKALKQKAAGEAQQAADMLAQERKEHQQTRQRFESKIAELQDQHAAAMKRTELKQHSAIDSVQKQIQEKFVEAEKGHQSVLNALEKKHAEQIAQLQDEKNAEIEALKQKAAEEAQQAADMLAQERKEHQQTRQRFESKVVKLEAAIRDTEKQRLSKVPAGGESQNTDLLNGEGDHKHPLDALEEEYTAEIAQFQDEKDEEYEELPAEEWLEELDP